MDDELLRSIINQISKYQKYVKVIYPFLMGEPLTDKSIFDRVSYIKQKVPSAEIRLDTSASLLSKSKAECLANSAIDRILFHVSGVSEIHSKVMKLNTQKVLENINYFLSLNRAKKKHVAVGMFKNIIGESETNRAIKYWNSRGN